MKLFLKILFAGIVLMSQTLCTNNEKNKTLDSSKIVKIVKTSAFTAKNEFDKLVPDEPVYDLGYDRTMGLDFSWRIKHSDEFDNILCLEKYRQNKKGEEEVLETVYNKYFSSSEGKLSNVKIDKIFGITEKKYNRNEEGVLMEIQTLENGKMDEKIICTYNEFGQKVKEEIYQESGLVKSFQYTYDIPSLSNGNIIKEIHHSIGKYKYRIEYDYYWSESNHLIKSKRKYYQDGKLLSDLVTHYESYVGNIATKEITEGYNLIFDTLSREYIDEELIQQRLYRTTIDKSLNSYGDITKYIRFSKHIDQDGNEIKRSLLYDIGDVYECEYTYNKRNDWIKVLLSVDPFTKYIIIREITYID